MNFLNPLALIGLAAASIPLVLHLLNLRRLKTVDFGTLRFLHELQQKQVRKLRLQQLLLLIIRTLLVIFAVLALSRPTIESKLPLLGATSRSSVVILIDNSGSMEAADGYGPRLGQAKKAAKEIVDGLRDGDEVVVLPMTGVDPTQRVDFTRTFAIAREQIDAVSLSSGTASMPASLRSIGQLLDRSLHRYNEIYIISDAQTSLSWREAPDSGAVLQKDASVFLVRIGEGQTGLEQNLSVDSIHVVTKLLQPDKPIEIEAFVRNGSTKDMQGALVSLAFDNKRIAQISVDIKAGTTKRVALAASPQRYGMISASVELESDAIDKDNVRYAGLLVPRPSRVALIGTASDQALVRTVLSLPGMERFAPSIATYQTMAQASSAFNEIDVLMITQGSYSSADGALVRQFLDEGGGAMVFAGNGIEGLLSALGVSAQARDEAPDGAPFRVKTVDKTHPLYSGVFVSTQDQTTARETTKILRLQPASGGFDIVQTDAGPLISEFVVGQGRLLYVSVAPDVEWSTYPLTGLFAATTIRSTIYLVAPRDQGMSADVAQAISVPIPPRLAGTDRFVVSDASGVTTELPPARLPSATFLSIPPQFQTGVVKISTPDSIPVTTVSVNSRTAESMLSYYSAGEWEKVARPFVINPDHVVELDQGASVAKAIESARTGSELWGLFTVLALLMAATEMIVARFMAQDTAAVDPA
jgi:hypothetical protein